ncbi:Lon protease [uncultured archaeon]|nr:Lon protease [uncultured archaeon]
MLFSILLINAAQVNFRVLAGGEEEGSVDSRTFISQPQENGIEVWIYSIPQDESEIIYQNQPEHDKNLADDDFINSVSNAIKFLQTKIKIANIQLEYVSDNDKNIGPSSGLMNALAIYSLVNATPFAYSYKKFGITGAINEKGNVLIVGEVDKKLEAAKKNGITLALIPALNAALDETDYNAKYENKNFKIIKVINFAQAYNCIFKKNCIDVNYDDIIKEYEKNHGLNFKEEGAIQPDKNELKYAPLANKYALTLLNAAQKIKPINPNANVLKLIQANVKYLKKNLNFEDALMYASKKQAQKKISTVFSLKEVKNWLEQEQNSYERLSVKKLFPKTITNNFAFLSNLLNNEQKLRDYSKEYGVIGIYQMLYENNYLIGFEKNNNMLV